MINPRQIHSVLTVVETGSVNRAAEQLHLAPSSVSAQIRELSSSLGITLFEQEGRNIVLSTAGRELLPSFRNLYTLTREIEQQAKSISSEPRGEIKLFAPSSMCIYRLPGLIEAIQIAAPQLEITLTHEPYDYQNALRNREIDAAILVSETPDPQWCHHLLATEEVIYICHPERHRDAVMTLEQLQDQPVITTEPGCSYRVAAEQHFKRSGLNLLPKQAFSNVEVVKRCLLANMGIGLLPRCVVAYELEQGVLREQAVEGVPYRFESMLVYPKQATITPKLRVLIEAVEGSCR